MNENQLFYDVASRHNSLEFVKLLHLIGFKNNDVHSYVQELQTSTAPDDVKWKALNTWKQYIGRKSPDQIREILQTFEDLLHKGYEDVDWVSAEEMLTPLLKKNHREAREIYRVIEEISVKYNWTKFIKLELFPNKDAVVNEITSFYQSIGRIQIDFHLVLRWKSMNRGAKTEDLHKMFYQQQQRPQSQQSGENLAETPQPSLEGGQPSATNPGNTFVNVGNVLNVSTPIVGNGTASIRGNGVVTQPSDEDDLTATANGGTNTAIVESVRGNVSDNHSGSRSFRSVGPLTNDQIPIIDQEVPVASSSPPYSSLPCPSGYPEDVTHDGNLASEFNSLCSENSTRDDAVQHDGVTVTQAEMHVAQLNNDIKPVAVKAFSSLQQNANNKK